MLSDPPRLWATPEPSVLTPDVMYVVEPADLREEPGERLVALPAEVDRACPVVAPLNHRSRLQEVAADFVQVFPGPRRRGWPEAERQQVLGVTCPQQTAPLLHQGRQVLTAGEVRYTNVRNVQATLRTHVANSVYDDTIFTTNLTNDCLEADPLHCMYICMYIEYCISVVDSSENE